MDKDFMKIGCHVSVAGGVFNAPKNAADLGCETFQIFTRPPQGGPAPELTPELVGKFRGEMEKHGLAEFVVHCPYFVNFASAVPRIYHGSVSLVRQELERSSLLGAKYVMTHLGSAKDLGRDKGMAQVLEGLKKVLEEYKGTALFLMEISAGTGEVVGDTFEELAALAGPLAKYEGFGGICFDTQHAFASGYDLRTSEAVAGVFEKFDNLIGLEYLKMSHINDSKIELGGRKDRHEHLGEGKIGEDGFAALLGFFSQKKPGLPLILETEHDKVKSDLQILKTLRSKLKK